MIRQKTGRRYTVRNKQRYVGESPTIRFFSLEEHKFIKFLETSEKVITWKKVSSDTDENSRFLVKYQEDDGSITENVIRVNQKQPKRKRTGSRSTHNQGYYTLRNPDKYRGDVNNVRFMSSWELNVHKFLDNNPNVIEWASEEVVVTYIKPTDNRPHKYYIDYYVKMRNREGKIIEELWEVKPERETKPPTKKGKKSQKTILYEQITYAVNQAKWKSATLFAKQHGMVFRVLTEKHIFK